jgi:hypothetical protein
MAISIATRRRVLAYAGWTLDGVSYWLRILVWPAVIVAPVAYLFVFGLPEVVADRIYRPMFMSGCVGGNFQNDLWVRECSAAYRRYRALQKNNWNAD